MTRTRYLSYEEWNDEDGRIKEEHPIIQKILKGKKPVDLLIPKGVNSEDRGKWLPKVLL